MPTLLCTAGRSVRINAELPARRLPSATPFDAHSDFGTQAQTGALPCAIFTGTDCSSIATGAHGVIQIFNAGAEPMLAVPPS